MQRIVNKKSWEVSWWCADIECAVEDDDDWWHSELTAAVAEDDGTLERVQRGVKFWDWIMVTSSECVLEVNCKAFRRFKTRRLWTSV